MIYDRNANARLIQAGNIDRDPVGRRLTPAARERAITHAVDAWTGTTCSGDAARIGIRHVTADVLRRD